MNAYLISIGDELLIGQTLNSNGYFIAKQLNSIQVNVVKTTVVGDIKRQILDEFRTALDSADLVIVTGGLGPTHDDVTRECVAEFFETKLIESAEVLTDIKRSFEKKGRELTQVNIDQALVPEIAEVIRNSRGTAPGAWIEKENKIFVSMPGVPYEMEAMMTNYVIPKLNQSAGIKRETVQQVNLLTTGIPESKLYEQLGDLDELIGNSKLAFLPSQFGVKMRITVSEDSPEDAANKITEIEQKIRTRLGRYIYGKNDDTIEGVVARLLTDRQLTIAVAESCTGGLISNRLTNIPGSSNYFERGLITYSNGAKVELLKVDEDHIQKYGAVSIEVARQMAEGVKAVSGTDIGLAVTGIMGPTGASTLKPVGLVYIGICDDTVCSAREYNFGEDRLLNKDRTAQAALDMLRRSLLGIPYDE